MNRIEFMNIIKKNIKEVDEDKINTRANTLKNMIDIVARQELEDRRLAKNKIS